MIEIKCLDKGFARLVDYMAGDEHITFAARVSYGPDNSKKSNDEQLIRYLIRNHHTSPLEMCEFIFHLKLPIFVARQLIRHRSASVNEISGRYTELKDECYIPETKRISYQSKNNKQGSEGNLEEIQANEFIGRIQTGQEEIFSDYNEFLDKGIARELARINLPLSTYSEMYWKMDLNNLFKFLKLRMDSHSQYEIRVYANAIFDLIKPIVPYASKAFEDYILNAKTFSAEEIQIIQDIIATDAGISFLMERLKETNLSKREINEFKTKLEIKNED